ncbi:MAG TPA: hypothetical protein VD995_08665 [Azospirillum sp.]|nr:hypothetical protein [Azospirillum sp.]
MSHTNIVALFDTRADADATFRSLVDAGFDDTELEVISDGGYGAGDGYGALIPQLRGWGVPDDEAHAYAEGVQRGGALLVASLTHAEPIERAIAIIEGGGAVNMGERAATWRASGHASGRGVIADETVGHTPVEDIPSPETVESRRTLSDAASAFREANTDTEPKTTEAGGIHAPPVHGPGTASPSYEPGSASDVARSRLDRTPPRDRT